MFANFTICSFLKYSHFILNAKIIGQERTYKALGYLRLLIGVLCHEIELAADFVLILSRYIIGREREAAKLWFTNKRIKDDI